MYVWYNLSLYYVTHHVATYNAKLPILPTSYVDSKGSTITRLTARKVLSKYWLVNQRYSVSDTAFTGIDQKLANFFCTWPEHKYFSLCGPHGLCCNCHSNSTLPRQCQSSQRQYANKRAWPCSNKTFISYLTSLFWNTYWQVEKNRQGSRVHASPSSPKWYLYNTIIMVS